MRKIMMLVIILLLITLTGCINSPNTTEQYKVTDKNVENGKHTLVLDGFKTVEVDDVIYAQIDVGDRVEVDNDTQNIIQYKTKEESQFEAWSAIFILYGAVGVIAIIALCDWLFNRGKKDEEEYK